MPKTSAKLLILRAMRPIVEGLLVLLCLVRPWSNGDALAGGLAWPLNPGVGVPPAMALVCLALVAVVGVLAFVVGAVRSAAVAWRTPEPEGSPTTPPLNGAAALLTQECAELRGSEASRRMRVEAAAPAGEPFVAFQANDLVGLALSGGGIRSATFNLGLLQGLHRLHFLPRIDILSTVSGGGYIGSYWSSALARGGNAPGRPPIFSTPRHCDEPSGPGTVGSHAPLGHVETAAERHLREFGRFLAPRVGLLEVETWTALVAMLSGLLPALAIALAVIGMALVAWLLLTIPIAAPGTFDGAATMVVVTLAVFAGFEYLWQKTKLPTQDASDARAVDRRRDICRYRFLCVVTLMAIALLYARLPDGREAWAAPKDNPRACPSFAASETEARSFVHEAGCWSVVRHDNAGWWRIAGLARTSDQGAFFSPALFAYSVAWLGAALALLLLRLAHPLLPGALASGWVPPLDRVMMRVLGLAVFWAAIAGVWHVAVNLPALLYTALGAVTGAGAFSLLRNWIGVALQKPRRPDTVSRAKAALPQVLAYVTLALTVVAVGQALVIWCGARADMWQNTVAGMSAVLALGLFIDPAKFGLHAFYRARISRAYGGASNVAPTATAAQNRVSDEQPDDDLPLSRLASRPLHLVCCAANDLNGDHLGTLARGARSAVLSKHGFSVGAHAAGPPTLSLGAAVTASAAAFNSNMGDVSMTLGPAVSFLMTALNLRLGLWVRHPAAAAARPRGWPGLLIYRELFGMTAVSGEADGGALLPLMRDVHLSDGGHFENLGLYELIRRHCRYVIASDCGADPQVAFDDLGRALRRVRQDFGVDVSIDIEALRPDEEGQSLQHVAIGRIKYAEGDEGILLYVKPTLTGDEPADVRQYKTRNDAFPHEGTGDQFYDEAQWESYRRLGLHVTDEVFGVLGFTEAPKADVLFVEAAHRWGPTPPGLEARVLEMTRRVTDLEVDLRDAGALALLHEFFPELGVLVGAPPRATSSGSIELVLLLRITQVMEDVWLACHLDRWWSHPLNMGWVNLFARWVTAPTFRFWWPLVGPMYSQGFRRFIEARFPVPPGPSVGDTANPWEGTVRRRTGRPDPSDLAAHWWETRSGQPCPWRGATTADAGPHVYYEHVLTRVAPATSDTNAPQTKDFQVGLVAVHDRGTVVAWTSDDFFVPPSLWGASLGWHFLKGLLATFETRHAHACVVIRGGGPHTDPRVARQDVRAFVDQYRKIGFRLCSPEKPFADLTDEAIEAVRHLGYDQSAHTLLVLDLTAWRNDRQRQES